MVNSLRLTHPRSETALPAPHVSNLAVLATWLCWKGQTSNRLVDLWPGSWFTLVKRNGRVSASNSFRWWWFVRSSVLQQLEWPVKMRFVLSRWFEHVWVSYTWYLMVLFCLVFETYVWMFWPCCPSYPTRSVLKRCTEALYCWRWSLGVFRCCLRTRLNETPRGRKGHVVEGCCRTLRCLVNTQVNNGQTPNTSN